MRIPIIAGNWKMNTNIQEAVILARNIAHGLSGINNIECVICPPFISLQPVKEILADTSVELGAQNMYYQEKGAFTGEISPLMLKGICKYVILGHSERRQLFFEHDELINSKIQSAFAHNLLPILCVGESLVDNNAGKTKEVLYNQLTNCLKSIQPDKRLVVAYEPIWAIGTGKAATALQAATAIDFIRQTLADIWHDDIARDIRILYGGSVTPDNIGEFVEHQTIDGALVGGASLKAADFINIVKNTSSLKA